MTDLVVAERNPLLTGMEALVSSIQQTETLGEAIGHRARIQALKEWAKAHDQVKAMRLDLLRVEVHALLKVIELGGEDLISKQDLEAGRWLANMDDAEREALIVASGTTTTVAGMCRAIWREDEIRANRARAFRAGIHFAEEPAPVAAPYDEDSIKAARRHATGITAALAEAAQSFMDTGTPFSIEDMADEVITDAGIDEQVAADKEFRRGVRSMCRDILRRSPALTLNGTTIPAVIIARAQNPDGPNEGETWVRIPTPNAKVSHLDEMIALRREQLAIDTAALRRLTDFADQVKSHPGVTAETRIGQVLAASIADDDEQVAS